MSRLHESNIAWEQTGEDLSQNWMFHEMLPFKYVLAFELNLCCTCTVSTDNGCRFIHLWVQYQASKVSDNLGRGSKNLCFWYLFCDFPSSFLKKESLVILIFPLHIFSTFSHTFCQQKIWIITCICCDLSEKQLRKIVTCVHVEKQFGLGVKKLVLACFCLLWAMNPLIFSDFKVIYE